MLDHSKIDPASDHRTAGNALGGARTLTLGMLIIVVIGLVWAARALTPIVWGGTGYAAKNLCSGHFLSGMSAQSIVREALLGASPLLGQVSYQVDTMANRVEASLFGLFKRTALYSPGVGCTLFPQGVTQLTQPVTPTTTPALDPARQWPFGTKVTLQPRLQKAIDQAFLEPDEEAPRHTKAVVVIHQGKLVAEHYAPGVTAQTPLIGWSMTKSITNLLLGLLVKDGALQISNPAPVPLWQTQSNDPRAQITINNLLQMSSGLAFNEVYSAHSDVTEMLGNQPDAGKFAASMPLTSAPGTYWSYSSGTSNILSAIIRREVGGTPQHAYDFAQQRLFGPLGIRTATLELDASGTVIGSSYMYASARDWGRLGLLCLQKGIWDGQALLTDDWIDQSTTPAPADATSSYGAHFWLNRQPKDPNRSRAWPQLPDDAYAMNGFQGQRVFIVPSQDLVVVRLGFTAQGNHGVESLVAAIINTFSNPKHSVES